MDPRRGGGCFPVHLCLPTGHTLGDTWQMPNEQGTEEARPEPWLESPTELRRARIPQGPSPTGAMLFS